MERLRFFLRVLPVIKNCMNDNYSFLNGIENRKRKSSDERTSKSFVLHLVEFWVFKNEIH